MSDCIERQIEVNAPLSRVWRALTDYREFGQWFQVRITRPFSVGERSSGQVTYPGYEHVLWDATVLEMTPMSRFSYSWHPYAVDKHVDYSDETPTVVLFELSSLGAGKTHLRVTETGFDKLPPHRRDLSFRMNHDGWEEQLNNIKRHAETET